MSVRWIVAGSLLVLGCDSTGVGNPPVAGRGITQVAMTLDQTGEATGTFLPGGSFETAVLNVREMSAFPCDSSEPLQRFTGPFEVDLKRGGTFALPDIANTESGICSVHLSIAEGDADASHPGECLHAEASFDGYQVTIALRGPLDLVLQTREKASWGLPDTRADPASSVIIALRPEQWLTRSEVILGTSPGGKLVVNAATPVLDTAVRLRIGKSTTILRDLDGDQLIDAIELGIEQILAQGK